MESQTKRTNTPVCVWHVYSLSVVTQVFHVTKEFDISVTHISLIIAALNLVIEIHSSVITKDFLQCKNLSHSINLSIV